MSRLFAKILAVFFFLANWDLHRCFKVCRAALHVDKDPINMKFVVCTMCLQSKEGVLKRGAKDDESSCTSSKKKTKKSKHKKHKLGPPSAQSNSQVSQGHQIPNQQKNNKMPQMMTTAVNANGQKHLCSTSKVRLISAWVDSVDHAYAPSEQGTCISSPTHSHAESTAFFSMPDSQEPSEVMGSQAKKNNTRDVSSKHPSPLSQKGSLSAAVSATVGKQRSKGETFRNAAGNLFKPVSPLSSHVSGAAVNTDRTNATQQIMLNPTTVHKSQSAEDMQLDSQQSFHSYANDHFNVGYERTQFGDDNEMAMDIDNYAELEDQIRQEV